LNDRRRFLLALVLGFCISILFLVAGEIFLNCAKQNIRQIPKTISVMQVALGKSTYENIPLPQTDQVDFAPKIEQVISQEQIIAEKIIPSQEIINEEKFIAAEENVSANYFATASEEKNISASAISSTNTLEAIDDNTIFPSSEYSAEAEKNKLSEMIYALIEENKQYPPLAKRRNIEGNVDVSITVSSLGELKDANVSLSSSSSILDQAAINLVKNIFPLNITLQSERSIMLTIRYSLK
jgi:protein TonB